MCNPAVLDRFIESALYTSNLADNGASKTDHDRANRILSERERELIEEYSLTSDQLNYIVDLTEEYRKGNDSAYEEMAAYVKTLR